MQKSHTSIGINRYISDLGAFYNSTIYNIHYFNHKFYT